MAYDSSDKPGSTELDRNPDPITGAPGSHPLGTGIGTGSGALAGAALGAIGGPVGAAIGLIAGGITGAIIGHEAGEYNDPTEDVSPVGASRTDATRPYTGLNDQDAEYYRTAHGGTDYAANDFDADLTPAYGYGSEVGRQASQGERRTFADLDTDLRAGWEKVRGKSRLDYDQARPAIENAYNRNFRADSDPTNIDRPVQNANVRGDVAAPEVAEPKAAGVK